MSFVAVLRFDQQKTWKSSIKRRIDNVRKCCNGDRTYALKCATVAWLVHQTPTFHIYEYTFVFMCDRSSLCVSIAGRYSFFKEEKIFIFLCSFNIFHKILFYFVWHQWWKQSTGTTGVQRVSISIGYHYHWKLNNLKQTA